MKLYFLRHGLAGDPGKWEGNDFDRPLTEEGKEKMAREGAVMARLKLDPEAILTSPLVRARQTAEIVATELNLSSRLTEDVRLGPGFGLGELAAILDSHSNSRALMLVGHEPSMSDVVGELTGGTRVVIKKGGLARVDLSHVVGLEGELVWLIPPAVLGI